MRYMKNVVLMLYVFLTAILLTSCKTCPPSDASEEIASYSWVSKNETGECRLSFEDECLILSCNLSEKDKLKIEGRYFADDKTITLESEDCGTLTLEYKLDNDKLSLNMYNMSIVLTKE